MILGISFCILIGNIYIHFFKKESLDDQAEFGSMTNTLKKLKFFIKNKNLLWLIFFLMTRTFGFAMIDGVWD